MEGAVKGPEEQRKKYKIVEECNKAVELKGLQNAEQEEFEPLCNYNERNSCNQKLSTVPGNLNTEIHIYNNENCKFVLKNITLSNITVGFLYSNL